jgi:oligopeptide transport system permease protein
MGRYLKPIFLRLGQFAASLLILLFLCFGLLRFFPGNPLNDEKNLDPQVSESLKQFYGLDQSLTEQFIIYVKRVLTGDFGASMHFVGRSVESLMLEFGRTSFSLGVAAFAMAISGAFAFAIFSRLSQVQKRKYDFLLVVIMSAPTLALGPLCIWFFGFYLKLLPVALLDSKASYLLPLFLLSLKPMISLARVLASSLDQVLQEKYILNARSLGFSQWQIVSRYALRNALNSFLSQAGPLFASLISGSFLIEIMFAIPGLGFHFVESILNRDWPMILGFTFAYGSILMITQLITDFLIVLSDPRIKAI